MRLSVVTTLYRSEGHVVEFHRGIRTAAGSIPDLLEVELIFVNNDSPDGSLRVARTLAQNDDSVRIIDLSRTFGNGEATMTGLAHATGDLIFVAECESKNDPELLPVFYRKMQDSGADLVYGFSPTLLRGWRHRLVKRLFQLVSGASLPHELRLARLMTARYLGSLLLHRDREIYLAALSRLPGFLQVAMPVSAHENQLPAADSFFKTLNAIAPGSSRPLVLIFYLGTAIMAVSIVAVSYLLVNRLFFRTLLSGWPSLIASVWLLGGLTLFTLGLIGIYLGKILNESKDRPYTIVRRVYSEPGAREESGTPGECRPQGR
jgi:putative glycosyltransferase